MWLRQSELHHIGERTLLQLVAVQRQKLLELTAHFTVLWEREQAHPEVKAQRFLKAAEGV